MKIIIGGNPSTENKENLVLNGDNYTGCPIIVTEITGLDTAPFRNGTGDWSGWDGGYMSAQFFSGRTITISGAYIEYQAGCDYSNTDACDYSNSVVRYYIRSHLPIRTLLPIRFLLDNGLVYYTEGYCVGIEMPYSTNAHLNGEYQITFYCPDAPLYRLMNKEISSLWLTGDIVKSGTSGYPNNIIPESEGDKQGFLLAKREETPPEFPDAIGQYWSAGGRGLSLNYCGDYPYEPVITIKGPVVNPTIYNTSTNTWFGLGSYTNQLASFAVTSAEQNQTAVRIALSDNNYGGIYSDSQAVVSTASTVGSGLRVRCTYTENDDKDVISLSDEPVLDANYIGDFTSTTLPTKNPHTSLALVNGNWCNVTDTGFEYEWVENTDPSMLGSWVKTSRVIGTTPQYVAFEVIYSGSGYAIGDFCELKLSGADQSTDERAVIRVASVGAEGQIMSVDVVSYGLYSVPYSGDIDVVSVTGSGTGAILRGTTERRTITGSYAIESVAVEDGGYGYEVGQRVALIQTDISANDVSMAHIEILEIGGDGKIIAVGIVDAGEYEDNKSATDVPVNGTLFGNGATLNVGMSQNPRTRLWSVTSVEVNNPGTGYQNGEYLQIRGEDDTQFKLGLGQTATIDCANKTVTVGGQSRSYSIRPGSSWLYLAPHTLNSFVYTSADQEQDVESARIQYKLAFMGI